MVRLDDPESIQFDIERLLNRLERRDGIPQDIQDRWNFITDVDTNEIRPEGLEAALDLRDDLIWIEQEGTDPN